MRRALVVGCVCAMAASAALAAMKRVTVGGEGETTPYPFNRIWSTGELRAQGLVLAEDGVPAGNIAGWEWNARFYGSTGDIKHFSVKCCHTPRSTLTSYFDDNYAGNTPVTVYTEVLFLFYMGFGGWVGPRFKDMFYYNGRDNLIVEVQWEAKSRYVYAYLWYNEVGGRYVVRNGKPGLPGIVMPILHYQRITIYPISVGGGPGLGATSLGRVKSMYH